MRTYTLTERLPLAFDEYEIELPKPDVAFCEISPPPGAVITTISLLLSPLPLSVKLADMPAVPWVVPGNVNEVVLTFSTATFTLNNPKGVVAI